MPPMHSSYLWALCLPVLCLACGSDRSGPLPCDERESCADDDLAPDASDPSVFDPRAPDASVSTDAAAPPRQDAGTGDSGKPPTGDASAGELQNDAAVTEDASLGQDAAPTPNDAGASDGDLVDGGAHDADASDAAASDASDTPDGSAATEPDAAADALASDAGADSGTPIPSAGPKLPLAAGPCPEFQEGTVTFAGTPVRLWLGSDGETKRGPLVFYWYATGSSVAEVSRGLGDAVVAEIKQLGGMVAALEKTTKQGTNTGNGVWYTGDFAIADEVLACAIAKGVGIDTSHIHAAGFSAGGLQTSWMAYARSNYLASVVPYSGGLVNVETVTRSTQDASNVVAAMMVHGKPREDWYIIDFSVTSAAMVTDIKAKGGFVIDCTHEEGHSIPWNIGPWSFRFMMAHGYKPPPSPYLNGLPSGFPSYCTVP